MGIALGSQGVACAYISKQLLRLSVRHCQTFPLPEGPDSGRQKALSDALTTFLQRLPRIPDCVVVSLPRQEAVARHLTLPMTAKSTIPEVMQYELERLVPFSPEEVFYDYLLWEQRGAEPRLELMVFCLPRGLVNSHLEILDKVGLKPYKLTLNSLEVLNCLLLEREEDGPIALLSRGEKEVEMSVATSTRLLTSQVFSFPPTTLQPGSGQAGFGTGSSTSLRTGFSNGQEGSFGQAQDRPFDSTQDRLTALLEQEMMRRRPDLRLAGVDVWQWTANGGATKLDGLEKTEDLRAWVYEHLRPAAENGLSAVSTNGMLPFSLAAVGAAVDAVDEGYLSINFIPEANRAKKEKRVTVFTLALCALVLVLTLALAAATVSMHWKVINRLSRRVEILQGQTLQLEQQEVKVKELRAKLAELAKDNDPRLTPLLKELAELLPAQIYLLSFEYQRGEVKLQGITRTSASELVPLLENSPWLRQVSLGPTNKMPQGDIFSLQAQVEK
jgi:Tfp pilus assembly protein PilN